MPHPLTDEQAKIVDRIVNDPTTNFRILGRAGTGKTHTLQALIRALWENGQWNECVAPTGAAAVRVSTTIDGKQVWATTLHKLMGFRNPSDTLIKNDRGIPVPLDFEGNYKRERSWQIDKNTMTNNKVIQKIAKLRTLIIEECSMVDADIFERMSQTFSMIRGDMRPFGGCRVILVGDFKQLRPVKDQFLFESPLFAEMEFVPLKLERIIRTDDAEYIQFQHDIAVQNGRFLTNLSFLQNRWTSDSDLGEHTYDFTHLYDYNRDALAWNKKAVEQLFPSSVMHEFDLYDEARDWNDPRKVNLCENMRVMITMNESVTLSCVNGDIGTIVRFEDVEIEFYTDTGKKTEERLTPIVKLHRNGEEVAVPWRIMRRYDRKGQEHIVFQLPCRPAYAATVHKFQGLTADGVVVHSRENQHGKQFVALTRCRNSNTLLCHRDHMGAVPRTTFDPLTPFIDF